MTDLLWMRPQEDTGVNPNYVRRFDAEVTKARRDWLLLDRTAFYAEGGGQPSDRGTLRWDGGEARVEHVSKRGVVKHRVDGDLPEAGTPVEGEVEWERRYRLMRFHTSQHVVSAEAHRLFDVGTEGASLAPDHATVILDEALRPGELDDLRDAVDAVLTSPHPVRVTEVPRDEAEARVDGDRVNLHRLPQSVRRLRLVEVADVDLCPCAGTHVASTDEIGPLGGMALREEDGGDWVLRYELENVATAATEND